MPPYSLEGTVKRNCTLVVLNEETWTVEETTTATAGVPFDFEVPTSGTKTVIGRMFNGCSVGYGGVVPSEPITAAAQISNTSYDGFMYSGAGWPSVTGLYYSNNGQRPWSNVVMGRQNNVKCEPVVLFHLDKTIPSAATITSATFEGWQGDYWNSSGGTIRQKIRAEENASPSFLYSGSAYNSLNLTTAAIAWAPTLTSSYGYHHVAPDITDVIQEVIDTVGAVSSIFIIFNDNGSTGQYCRMGFKSPGVDASDYCKLTITYA